MVMSLQDPSWMRQSLYAKTQEKNVIVNFLEEKQDQSVNITIHAVPADDTKQITSIELPNGERILGDNAAFMSKKSGTYDFKVFYRDKTVQNPTITTEGIKTPKEVVAPHDGIAITEGAAVVEGMETPSSVPSQERSEIFSYKVEEIKKKTLFENKEVKKKKKADAGTAGVNSVNYFLFNASTNTITGYSSSSAAPKDIVIPEQINGVDVLHIANNAFQGQQLTSVAFNTTKLQTIGDNAFHNNQGLAGDLVIPEGVKSIGASAFAGGTKLVSISIPSSVRTMGVSAFADNRLATSINLAEGITSIPNNAFKNCEKAASFTIPNSVTRIGERAFENWLALTSITIPDHIYRIEALVFTGCTKLVRIDIPTKAQDTIHGSYAPWGAPNAIVYWKTTLVSNDWVFQTKSGKIENYTGNATDVVMPTQFEFEGAPVSVKSFDSRTFKGNINLRSVVIANGIVNLTSSAFEGCRNLVSVTFPQGVRSIDTGVFKDCVSLTSITLPESITSIEHEAFYGCTKLDNVILPNNVLSIGQSAFEKCTSLSNITLPNKLKTMSRFAFRGCTSLRSITIPDTLTKLEDSVFEGSGLINITIPENINTMGNNVFANCKSLSEIHIPSKYSDRLDGAAWGASNAIVYWRDTVRAGDWVFEGRTKKITNYLGTATTVVMPDEFNYEGSTVKVEGFGTSLFFKNETIQDVTIADGITSIPDNAFGYCRALRNVTIPTSVTSIGSYAFERCSALTNIKIPNSVTSIGKVAFSMTGLTSIVLPNRLTTISNYMFQNCEKLTSVTIPNSVTTIGQSAFINSRILASITIPNGVTIIGNDAFAGCGNLSSITIPDSVTSIGSGAFSRTSALTQIDIPTKFSGEISGSPWGASAVVYWRDTVVLNDWLFQPATKKIERYQGNEKNIIMPSEFNMGGTIVPVEQFTKEVFGTNRTVETIQIGDTITTIPTDAFRGSVSLKTVTLGSKVTTMPTNTFSGLSALESIFINQSRQNSSLSATQPWGADKHVKVYFSGEFVTFEHSLERVADEYARMLTISATVGGMIQTITLPDGSVANVGASNWETRMKITANGVYTFRGLNDAGVEHTYDVVVDDIGIPVLQSADEIEVNWSSLNSLTKQDLVALAGATSVTETGDIVVVTLTDQDLDAVKAMVNNQEHVFITLTTTTPAPWNKTVTKLIKVTLMKQKAQVQFEVNHPTLGSVNKTETQDVWVGDPLRESAAIAILNPKEKNAKFVGWYKVNLQTGALTYVGNNEKLKQEVVSASETYRAVFTKAMYEENDVNGPSYGVFIPSYLNVEDEKEIDASIQLVQLPNETTASSDFDSDLKVEVSVATKNNGYLVSTKNTADRFAYELYYGNTYDDAGFKLSNGDTVIKKKKTDETTFFRRADNLIAVDIPGKVYIKDRPFIKGRFTDVLTFRLRKIN